MVQQQGHSAVENGQLERAAVLLTGRVLGLENLCLGAAGSCTYSDNRP